MSLIVKELISLSAEFSDKEPSLRDVTAAAAFLAQFYTGIENILKRISYFHNVALPDGEGWHVELFQRFSSPGQSPLPTLFDPEFATSLAPYRRFRHVALHSYGFDLQWDKMKDGIKAVPSIFHTFTSLVETYLKTL